MSLDPRREFILCALVHEYIRTVEPISSGYLVENYQLGVSSATVRNELATLEKLGYLKQPHTSAGRIPTDEGYRCYVNSLTDTETLTLAEKRLIHRFYLEINKEMEDLIRETSSLLSRLTNYAAVVFAPALKKSLLKHVDLIFLRSWTILLALITDTGWVAKRVLELERPVRAGDLWLLESALNERLAKSSPDCIHDIVEQLFQLLPGRESLIRKVVISIDDCLAEENRRFYFGGASLLLQQPEFRSLEKVQALFQVFEQGYMLLRLLGGELEPERVVVKIGSENEQLGMEDCSLVIASYQVADKSLGVLGLLGPTRMNYAKAISTVGYVAQNLSETLESLHG
ncbi:MAG TPA: heat-inducible transcription repressor HrcA [Actinobacteria bacterium]|nr:heat-inducible transcription repressor HrcA [Actinomycetota bacterium]